MSDAIAEKVEYTLEVADGDAPATVTLIMTREQALVAAFRLNKFLADIPADRVCLPVVGNLLYV